MLMMVAIIIDFKEVDRTVSKLCWFYGGNDDDEGVAVFML